MGLDIIAWEHAVPAPAGTEHDPDDPSRISAFVYGGFEHGLRPWPVRRRETTGWGTVLVYGPVLDVSGAHYRFAAGSYTGYGRWRSWLCRAQLGVDPQQVWDEPHLFDGEPFYELINFADNEGVLGPDACASLARSFDSYRGNILAKAFSTTTGAEGALYAESYDDWARATALAADTGVLVLR